MTITLDYLSTINAHERDSHITFKEDSHIYSVDGVSNYISVTTWNHSHFEAFDSDKIIERMMRSKKWPLSKYFGMTKEEIKQIWDTSKNQASGEGTKLHYDIECYYNNKENQNDSIEYGYFKKFVVDHKHLKPYRTEWIVWDEDTKISGTIDMVFENPDGTLTIYDWKRAREINKTNPFNKYAVTECISHLPDSNYWHYTLQLNTYKYILETKYNKKVSELYLLCLHPNNPTYLRIPVPILRDEINDLMGLKRLKLNESNKTSINKSATFVN